MTEQLNNNKVGDGKRKALLETSNVKVLIAGSLGGGVKWGVTADGTRCRLGVMKMFWKHIV